MRRIENDLKTPIVLRHSLILRGPILEDILPTYTILSHTSRVNPTKRMSYRVPEIPLLLPVLAKTQNTRVCYNSDRF